MRMFSLGGFHEPSDLFQNRDLSLPTIIMANSNLTSAKRAKNDEFYTQYHDIEKEVGAYVEFNPDVFRDKVVFLPCDDPEWSNFTKFFAQNFQAWG